MSVKRNNVPFITFYSYKGGSGRTVCAANTLATIAREVDANPDNPLLVMDMDIDSAGLSKWLLGDSLDDDADVTVNKLFDGSLRLGANRDQEILLKGLRDITDIVSPDLSERSIKLLPGTLQGRSEVIAPEGAESLKKWFGLPPFNFSAVVLDSASGRQEIARWCQTKADVLVYCSRLSEQHLQGTRYDIRRVQDNLTRKKISSEPSILIVPTAVPQESDTRNDLTDMRHNRLKELSRLGGGENHSFFKGGIPEVERFKFGEAVLEAESFNKQGSHDEKEALSAYQALSELIISRLKLKGCI